MTFDINSLTANAIRHTGTGSLDHEFFCTRVINVMVWDKIFITHTIKRIRW
jgi:hypothetical protein